MLFLISCTENEDLFNKQNRVSTSEYFDKRLISRSTSNISKNDAENIANIFFSPSITKAQPSNISIKEVICIKDKEDEPAFYILNYLSNNGFIIVSATKNYPPILAYSSSDNISLKTNTAAFILNDVDKVYLGYGNKYGYGYGAKEKTFFERIKEKLNN
jgi:hypothetical protein